MGKKDGKRIDPAKLQAKKARQAAKQQKNESKRNKKEIRDTGEIDIEALIAEITLKESSKTSVSVSSSNQPSRRVNNTLTFINSSASNEMLLFGGEFCDGSTTEVYNNVYRWNIDRNEWKGIESLNTPAPRCSHQAVIYQDKLYVFGGEYGTLDQFYHYRDFWELDLRTNIWKEVEATGDLPSARSGHRMLIWRNYLVLFGGFYEAMREVKWFNDLYFFSFQERKWINVPYKPNVQVPKPRSGHQMFLHASEDIIYIFGGFAKEKLPGTKREGKIHEDMWQLNLKPALPSTKGGNLDLSRISWQRISRKGDYPSPRCGAVITVYKNKALLFGGVYDIEGDRHCMLSTFFNDLYAFDMERLRWYKLGLKQKKAPSESRSNRNKSKIKASASSAGADDEEERSEIIEEEEGDEGDDDEEEDIIIASSTIKNKAELFGYIDESGAVVYIELDNDNEDEIAEIVDASDVPISKIEVVDAPRLPAIIEKESADTVPVAIASNSTKKPLLPPKPPLSEEVVHSSIRGEIPLSEDKAIASSSSMLGPSSYFSSQLEPCPRINPCIAIKGNTLIIYGGSTEMGDVEITLDDCWSLDLNKRDQWKNILPGTMHLLVWKGVEDDDASSRQTGGDENDSDDDDGDDSDDDGDDDDEDSDDDRSNNDKGDEDTSSDEEEGRKTKRLGKGSSIVSSKVGATGRRAEIEGLRAHFDMTDHQRTPLGNETLREFYSRTSDYWATEVIRKWQLSGKGDSDERLSEKEIKKEGFILAELRYQELLPLLSRLNELEEDQRHDEERHGGPKGNSKLNPSSGKKSKGDIKDPSPKEKDSKKLNKKGR